MLLFLTVNLSNYFVVWENSPVACYKTTAIKMEVVLAQRQKKNLEIVFAYGQMTFFMVALKAFNGGGESSFLINKAGKIIYGRMKLDIYDICRR